MTQPKFERHYINNEKGLITTYYKSMEVDQWVEKHFNECAKQTEQMENALKKLKKHSNAQSEAIMTLRKAFEKWANEHRPELTGIPLHVYVTGAMETVDLLLPALEALELIIMNTDDFESADVAMQALAEIKRKLEGE